MNQIDKLPVFIIDGFLESGKTTFLKFTMQQEYFKADGVTVLIICEDGEVEYDMDFLSKTNTVAVYIEDQDELTIEKLLELEKEYKPERILIEYNGMWLQENLFLPDTWYINQRISIFDTTTLDLYMKNMKAQVADMVKNSELIIVNRADDVSHDILANYHMLFRSISSDSEIVFEGDEGEIRGDFSIELPYDLNDDCIKLQPEHYGIFYVDSIDRADKYRGKTIEFIAQVLRPENLADNEFLPGRQVMTCCADDIQFLAWICKYDGASEFKNEDWVRVKVEFRLEYHKAYKAIGPVLYAKEVLPSENIKDVIKFE